MPRSEKKKQEMIENYTEKRKILINYLAAVDDVIAGAPEAKACYDNKVRISNFRNFIRRNSAAESNVSGKMIHYRTPEDEFIMQLLGNEAYVLPDFWESYEITTKYLTEREQKILGLRFKEDLTLEETAKEIGVTRERIRQIEQRALRKLRAPRYRIYFEHGVKAAKEYEESLLNSKKLNEMKEKNSEIEALILKEVKDNENLHGLYDLITKDSAEITPETLVSFSKTLEKIKADRDDMYQMPLDVLGLSVRSYNVLKRAGCNTVMDVMRKSDKELRYMRNMGEKSFAEIKTKLGAITDME